MRHLKLLLCALIAFGVAPTAEAVNYVDAPPLSSVVNTRVGNVAIGGTTEVPLITWGGDIATIYANGNAKNTASGSIFADQGLRLNLVREDYFPNQVERYLSGQSPYLRGTVGMINMARSVTDSDDRTKLVGIYQMTWSTGGDALVVKDNIQTAKDLCGKTIAVQAYGPHVDYLSRVVTDACGSVKNVTIKWTRDLTGDQSAVEAFRSDDSVDAAFVIIPDALALTSGGNVGTGAEDSVRGAEILMSTKTANRIIADIYAVRADFLKSNPEEVAKFVHGLMLGEEAIRDLFKRKSGREYTDTLRASATILLDAAAATADVEGLYADCTYVGYAGNTTFFTDRTAPRRFDALNGEIQTAFMGLGLLNSKATVPHAGFDYNDLKRGLTRTVAAEASQFDPTVVQRTVARRQEQGTLGDSEVFNIEIFFAPNQNTFSADQYRADFDKAIDLASAYGGAIITVEGHSDVTEYLIAVRGHPKKGTPPAPPVVQQRTKTAAKNLSFSRATAVRDAVIGYASGKGVSLDPNQFTPIGHGVTNPNTGMCGGHPCPPKNKEEWLSNMRVVFRIITVEAESDAFVAFD